MELKTLKKESQVWEYIGKFKKKKKTCKMAFRWINGRIILKNFYRGEIVEKQEKKEP